MITPLEQRAAAILREYPDGYTDLDPRRFSPKETQLLPATIALLEALEGGLDPRRIVQVACAVTEHSRARRVA